MTKARPGLIWFILTIAFGLTACAQSSDCFREDVFCAGLVTDALGIEDHGTNQNTWAGLQEAKSNRLIDQADYIESLDTRDYEKNIAYFVQKGYDVIITTGIGLRDETLRAADLNLDTVFVGINQPDEEPRLNFISITFPEDQMGFLAGALAARLSKTQTVGAVCETSGIDSVRKYCEGFRAGVLFINQQTDQNLKALVIYRENGDRESLFIDEDWGYDTAQELIQRGADVIFAAGGATGQGALRAAAEAGIKSIGTERDQGRVLAGSGSGVVTSILGNANFEIQQTLRLSGDENLNESKSGQIKYIPLPQTFPESLTREMDTLLLALSIGEVETGAPFEKP